MIKVGSVVGHKMDCTRGSGSERPAVHALHKLTQVAPRQLPYGVTRVRNVKHKWGVTEFVGDIRYLKDHPKSEENEKSGFGLHVIAVSVQKNVANKSFKCKMQISLPDIVNAYHNLQKSAMLQKIFICSYQWNFRGPKVRRRSPILMESIHTLHHGHHG